MPNIRWAWIAAWLAAAGLARAALPPATPTPGSPLAVDVWETEDGLPQNSVIAITQTRDGYLWLGTFNGLVRFDGLKFAVFDESNTPGLNSSRIVRLFEDSQENLWIGTESGGVALRRQGRITGLDLGHSSPERRLAAVCEDAAGAVWLHTASGELWRYWQGSTTPFLFGWGQGSACRALAAEAGGPVWIGTDRRVAAFGTNQPTGSFEPRLEQDTPVGKLDYLLARPGGGVWGLVDGRIQFWRGGKMERDLGPYPWRTAPVTAVCEDRQGNLVVGTLGMGIHWFGAEGNATWISRQQGLSSDVVLALCMDREGSLWVGTDGGGLNRVRRRVFGVLSAPGPVAVQSVCEDAQGDLWIGSNGSGITRWSGGLPVLFGRAEGLPRLQVWSVYADRSNRVWAGTYGGGLVQWREGRFQPAAGAAELSPVVTAICQDRQGALWVGTPAGLARWDGQTWKIFTTNGALSANVVQAIAEDRDGSLWIGTRGGGLNRLRDGRFEVIRKSPAGLPSDDISCLHADSDGVLWAGTFGSGLVRHQGGRWTRFTKREGLVSNSLGYLLEDDQGNLWMGSNAGLMRAPKQALNDFANGLAKFIPCRSYGRKDGLPSGECTMGSQPGPARSRDGRLWFPTIRGLVSVDPRQIIANTNPPPVMIEAVLLDTQLLGNGDPSANLTIPPGQNQLEIHYTSLNLNAPDRARFRYRLSLAGQEEKWIDAGNARVVRYPSLSPGKYLFQVTACNEDGVWNETGRSLALVVLPPFWRTWWFLAGVTVALLAAIVGGVHYFSTQRLQRQLERFRQQEALEKERARIARDIHDQLGASLTQVSLLGEMVESDKDLPAEVEVHARQISQTARDTTRALDEIVWTVNPSNDTVEGLANYICKYAQDYLGVAGIRYRLDAPPQLPAAVIAPDVRHNVFLAAKEAITNIVRHAQASAAWLRLRVEDGVFIVEIEDDGRGLSGVDEKMKTRNGLKNMRRRMEDLHGEFFIGPRADQGTVVRLKVPVRIGGR